MFVTNSQSLIRAKKSKFQMTNKFSFKKEVTKALKKKISDKQFALARFPFWSPVPLWLCESHKNSHLIFFWFCGLNFWVQKLNTPDGPRSSFFRTMHCVLKKTLCLGLVYFSGGKECVVQRRYTPFNKAKYTQTLARLTLAATEKTPKTLVRPCLDLYPYTS